MDSDISREPLQNQVAEDLGTRKAWKMIATDSLGNPMPLDSLGWTIRFQNAGDGQPIYVGYAVPGTADATATWLLHEYTYVGGFITARKVATDSWDNRAGATYS